MLINDLKELSKSSDVITFRRSVVHAYELGFITVEQVVEELKISRTELRRLCRFYYLQRIGLDKERDKEPKTGVKMAKSKKTLALEQRIAELEKLLNQSRLAQEAFEMMLAKALLRFGVEAGDIKKKYGSKSSKP